MLKLTDRIQIISGFNHLLPIHLILFHECGKPIDEIVFLTQTEHHDCRQHRQTSFYLFF